jgi:hypothetical protein
MNNYSISFALITTLLTSLHAGIETIEVPKITLEVFIEELKTLPAHEVQQIARDHDAMNALAYALRPKLKSHFVRTRQALPELPTDIKDFANRVMDLAIQEN